MLTGVQVNQILGRLGITHVIWIPDSVMGRWERELERAPRPLIRVCREGEAWPLAAGLHAGGAQPLIMMQSTGLFESGDALRNVIHDLHVPLYAWIGIRNWLNRSSTDSARRFAIPIIEAWAVDHVWMESAEDVPKMVAHFQQCRRESKAGMALLAEGAG
jgi:sulfopyruvate decarboxylase subunit alpha